MDNVGSSGDITMHTYGYMNLVLKNCGGHVFDGKATRAAGAKR